jgi:hypothetical protein
MEHSSECPPREPCPNTWGIPTRSSSSIEPRSRLWQSRIRYVSQVKSSEALPPKSFDPLKKICAEGEDFSVAPSQPSTLHPQL